MPATLLPSGKVLVAGGGNLGGAQNKVDVYDPETGTWSQGPNMGTQRRNHTATLLPSGKVLVVGGVWSASLATAEVYDPQSNTWTGTGGLTTARYDHTATLLPSGKVLVVGGRNSTGGVVGTAEEYDPDTGTWSAAGTLGSARELHTATRLSTGKVLVAGGLNGNTLGSAELYDPATRQWSAAPSMAAARHLHVAAPLESLGKVLVVGGLVTVPGVTSGVATAEAYGYEACEGVVCDSAPGQCYEAAGTCSNGQCTYAPKAAGAACDDGNGNTFNDTCNGVGGCAEEVTCMAPPSACHASPGTYADGVCTYPLKEAGASCGSGRICTATGQCLRGCWIADVYYSAGATNPDGVCQVCNPGMSTSSWSFKPSTARCRASGGTCDVAEYCTGTAAECPEDAVASAGTSCRAASGTCDMAEVCDGENKACPTNGYAPNGTSCGTGYSGWSSCGGFSDACDTTGTQWRTVTAYACGTGTCSAANTSTQTQACTRALDSLCLGTCPSNLTGYRGQHGLVVSCTCTSAATGSGSVWGTDDYTDDSRLCRAAVHAGRITRDGGSITAVVSPGLSRYISSNRNGITSSSYGSWPGSYYFQ
jgi:hypothetical protein